MNEKEEIKNEIGSLNSVNSTTGHNENENILQTEENIKQYDSNKIEVIKEEKNDKSLKYTQLTIEDLKRFSDQYKAMTKPWDRKTITQLACTIGPAAVEGLIAGGLYPGNAAKYGNELVPDYKIVGYGAAGASYCTNSALAAQAHYDILTGKKQKEGWIAYIAKILLLYLFFGPFPASPHLNTGRNTFNVLFGAYIWLVLLPAYFFILAVYVKAPIEISEILSTMNPYRHVDFIKIFKMLVCCNWDKKEIKKMFQQSKEQSDREYANKVLDEALMEFNQLFEVEKTWYYREMLKENVQDEKEKEALDNLYNMLGSSAFNGIVLEKFNENGNGNKLTATLLLKIYTYPSWTRTIITLPIKILLVAISGFVSTAMGFNAKNGMKSVLEELVKYFLWLAYILPPPLQSIIAYIFGTMAGLSLFLLYSKAALGARTTIAFIATHLFSRRTVSDRHQCGANLARIFILLSCVLIGILAALSVGEAVKNGIMIILGLDPGKDATPDYIKILSYLGLIQATFTNGFRGLFGLVLRLMNPLVSDHIVPEMKKILGQWFEEDNSTIENDEETSFSCSSLFRYCFSCCGLFREKKPKKYKYETVTFEELDTSGENSSKKEESTKILLKEIHKEIGKTDWCGLFKEKKTSKYLKDITLEKKDKPNEVLKEEITTHNYKGENDKPNEIVQEIINNAPKKKSSWCFVS